MKYTLIQFQPLLIPYAEHCLPDHVCIADELRHLEPLLPGITASDLSDPLPPVLAFLERYQHDVLQLESKWALLSATLISAWQRKDYHAVVRVVAGMARSAGRVCSIATAEHLLSLGVAASRHCNNSRSTVYFLNRLGGLLFANGRYWRGRQLWSASLQLAAEDATTFGLWQPLSGFACITDMLGNDTYARQFVEALLTARRLDETEKLESLEGQESLAVALFARGFYARHKLQLDEAREDFRSCLRILAHRLLEAPSSTDAQVFMAVVQAELARAEGHYARSQSYTEIALSLARVYSDRYTIAALLFDQGLYASQQNHYDDVPAILQQLRHVAYRMQTPHLHGYCRILGRYALETAQPCASPPACYEPLPLPMLQAGPYEPLSEREREALKLAAKGLSNREIAAQLVITPATVKKHLEHIYSKLDVHNRTSAIARARTLSLIP